jgi:glycogen debranching enzyme
MKQGELFLASQIETDGSGENAAGLYFRDTRFLKRLDVSVNGESLELLDAHVSDAAHATVTLTNLETRIGDHLVRAHQVAVEARVVIGSRLDITFTVQNFSDQDLDLSLGIDLASDFRDLFDIRGFERLKRGHLSMPEAGPSSCALVYEGLDEVFVRTLVAVDRPADVITFTLPAGDGTIGSVEATFQIPLRLSPGRADTAVLSVGVEAGGDSPAGAVTPERGEQTRVRTGHLLFDRVMEQCERDLTALETSFQHGVMPAAGIPWFVAPFGRDSLIVGQQTLHLRPRNAIGTLRVLASLQGENEDPETEEEPGKILHEMRYGEMARAREIPHRPYYGTNDATPLFAWLIAEVIGWTADPGLYAEFAPHAKRAFEWIDRYGDADGDGLIEYTTVRRGDSYITHKVWKDSHDSLHYPDGRAATGSIAAVEVQGYAYAAYTRMAEMAELFGDPAWAGELREKAERLRNLVETRFWLEAEHCYAQALDGDKQPIGALTSNAGHLLTAGLPSPERAALLSERYMAPDFSSGWGIRTLSSRMPIYNPMSYHNGSIWPHDNSLIAAGCYGYGLDQAGQTVLDALLAAALADADLRLPELYCGFPRRNEPKDRPVSYPVSCSPQAWAAGALPLLTRSMLGLHADTRSGLLIVQPRLPEWLEKVEISDLHALGQTGSLRVSRIEGGYELDVTGLNARLVLS